MEQATSRRLFVYGIFLGEGMRQRYGMTNPTYATVPGYITVGSRIVQAVPVENETIALTGLIVTPDEERWESLDYLEDGYDRVIVKTTNRDYNPVTKQYEHEEAYMYVQHQSELENHSTYESTYRGLYA